MESVAAFEKEWGIWSKTSNVVGCASGSAALHLSLEALSLPLGSEVLCPDYTMIACARSISLAGLTPVFVDCNDDLLIDVALIEDAITDRTTAIMPVHVYGRRCQMDLIAAIAGKQCLFIVEDLAEAHGVPVHPDTDAAAYSFYKNKIVCSEEGGAVSFRNPVHAALARKLRCLGFTEAHDYSHIPRGHNYRLSNAHAALIRESLAMADANIFLRRAIEAMYEAHCPPEWRQPKRDAVWIYDFRVKGMTNEQQTRVIRSLQAAGIAARFGFKPMSSQEEFKHCRVIGNGNAARLASEIIYLPVVPGQTTEEGVRLAFSIAKRELGDD